jgi:hypothetical protein
MWNKLVIKMYTRLWVRAQIFCCERNEALSKSYIVVEKKITILMVKKNRD